VPKGTTLNIELFGELAALLSLGIGPNDKHPLADAEGVQVTLVAWARNRRYLRLNYAEIQRSSENNQPNSLKILTTYFQVFSASISQGQKRRNNSPSQI